MRFRHITPEVWIGISPAWSTTCTIAGPDGALVVDGPVGPGDAGALGARASARELTSTHADWDLLLAPLTFPAARRRAGAATLRRLAADRQAIADDLAAWDAAHGVPARGLPDWSDADELASAGQADTPAGPVEIVPAGGHTTDGIAVLLVRHAVLVVGDYLSPAEIPSVDPDAGVGAYLATLARLDALIDTVDWVIPGHGWPLTRGRARGVLAADRDYLERIAATGDAPLPRHAGDVVQRHQHARNRAAARG
jgi:glyoxylase-like metal-dependent hydrolase (beta-lactamase superfamily II)